MRIEPFRIFFGIALVSLIGQFWIASPWMAVTFFYAALTAWLWNLAPIWFQSPLPRVTELFPVVMLLLFMMVLGGAPARSTSEALFYTASALVLFRGIIYLLLRVRNSKSEISTVAKAALVGSLLQMVCNAIYVYSTFRPVPESVLAASKMISVKGMMLILALGWIFDQKLEKRERNFGWILILGVLGNFYLAGAALMVNTVLFLKTKGFKYEEAMD